MEAFRIGLGRMQLRAVASAFAPAAYQKQSAAVSVLIVCPSPPTVAGGNRSPRLLYFRLGVFHSNIAP